VIPQEECEVLVSLFTGAGGLSRTKNDNWFGTTDVNERRGVRTGVYSGQTHVDGLFLQSSLFDDQHGNILAAWGGNNINGPLPSSLGDLTELRDMNLSRNTITGTLPASFVNLSNLEKIYMLDTGI
jgi:hypothetical protein